MEDKSASAMIGLGCMALLMLIAIVAGGLIGIVIAVAKWIAS